MPEVAEPVTVEKFLARPLGQDLTLIAAIDTSAARLKEHLSAYASAHPHAPQPGRVLNMIGPEGDFTPAECSLALSAGCLPLSLGPIILRTETAALYSLSTLGHELF